MATGGFTNTLCSHSTKHDTCNVKSELLNVPHQSYLTADNPAIQSVSKMVQIESRFCPTCESFFHGPDTCPKTLLIYQPVSNALVDTGANIGVAACQMRSLFAPQHYSIGSPAAALSFELRLRSALSEGVGDDCCRCDKHRVMHLQIHRKAPTGRHARVPTVLDDFDDSHVVERSLLPICSVCAHAETGLKETSLATGLDMCRCATMLARAACPNCVLGEINGAMDYSVLQRTKPDVVGFCKIACKCGNEVGAEETARQCAYCGGIATAPFRGYGGQELMFECGAEGPTLSYEVQSTREFAA